MQNYFSWRRTELVACLQNEKKIWVLLVNVTFFSSDFWLQILFMKIKWVWWDHFHCLNNEATQECCYNLNIIVWCWTCRDQLLNLFLMQITTNFLIFQMILSGILKVTYDSLSQLLFFLFVCSFSGLIRPDAASLLFVEVWKFHSQIRCLDFENVSDL